MRCAVKVFLAILLGMAVLATLIVTACFMVRPKGPRYFIHMGNRTPQMLGDVGVYYGAKIAAIKGDLVPGGYATVGFVTLPVPEEATVTWTEKSGVHHAPKVNLAGIVPTCPRNVNIWFIIDKDGSVTVRSVSTDDREANQALLITLNPYREKR